MKFVLLPSSSTTPGKPLLLGDVMVPVGDSSKNLPESAYERIKDIVIGAGYVSDGVLTKQEARELVEGSVSNMDIAIYGDKSRIVVQAPKTDITGIIIVEASAFLESTIENPYGDLVIRASENNPLVSVAGDSHTLGFRRLPSGHPSREKISVDIKVDGVLHQTVVMAFDIDGTRDVLVATNDIPAKSRLDGKQFESRRINIRDMDIVPCQCQQILQDMLSMTDIPKGQMLASNMVSGKNAVESGESVLVESIAGNTRIFVRALAISSGRIGDTVRLRNANSAASFEGVVQGIAMAYVGEAR